MKHLIAATILLAGSVFAHADDTIYFAKNCMGGIGREGDAYVLFTQLFHAADYIPAKKVVRIDATTLKYKGNVYKSDRDCG
jgi:hypothetical protein